MTQVIDTVNSIFQAITFSMAIFYCIDVNERKYKIKTVISSIVLFAASAYFTNRLGNLSVCVFITHILCLVTVMLVFRNEIIEAIIGYSMVYILMAVLVIVSNNIFFGIVHALISENNIDLIRFIAIYLPQILLMILLCMRRNYIKKIYMLIINEKKNSIILILTSFILDFLVAFNLIIYSNESALLKNLTFIIICIFFIVLISYFARIKQRADEIFELNMVLDEKNKELRKIKHDYGAQISYLYGLHLMNRFDDLGEALKKIINNNDSVTSAVEINKNNNVLLSLAMQPAIDQGIHVIIKDKCSLKKIDMTEMELYRILCNIVNNAVKAMKGRGIITAEVYEYMKNVVIKIENDGPKIQDENLKQIFDAGFTTKNNKDGNHGFGLSIVKELVESYNGSISVKSSDKSTEFKIMLPIREMEA
ncbi:MAG: sensor histidine kinase [Clostridium butyricum]|nr:sensor histidine kinase [Clostridium butyricum]